MAEERLDDADVGPAVNQVVPTSVPHHVRMDIQISQAGRLGRLRSSLVRVGLFIFYWSNIIMFNV
jgi:hypothetical protein